MARKRDRIRLNKHYVVGTVGKTYILLRDIPYKTSDLINDAKFQNKDQVDQLIASAIGEISSFTFEVVEELPEVGEEGVIYLVPAISESELDIYNEYVWVNSQYERLGSTSIDSVQVVHFEVVNNVLTADRTYSDIVSDLAEGKAVIGIYSENNVVDSYLVLNEFDGTGYDLVFTSQTNLVVNNTVISLSNIKITMSSVGVITKSVGSSDIVSVPTGGTLGQVLLKSSDNDYAVVWGDIIGLPSVTSDDNGKIVKVLNGVWTLATGNPSIPVPTNLDEGKILRINSNGEYFLDTLISANGVDF